MKVHIYKDGKFLLYCSLDAIPSVGSTLDIRLAKGAQYLLVKAVRHAIDLTVSDPCLGAHIVKLDTEGVDSKFGWVEE